MKEKEISENTIASLKKEMEVMTSMHEQQLQKIELTAKQMEEHLTTKIKEVESLLVQSNKKIEEVEAASLLKSQLWNKKEGIFQKYMNSQQLYVKVCLSLTCSYFLLFFILFMGYCLKMTGFKDIIMVYKK